MPSQVSEHTEKTISLEPTDAGYGKILALFAMNVMGTTLIRKRKSAAKQMLLIIELAAYLGSTSPQDLQFAKNEMERIAR